jgi:hypothetical protein
MWNQTTLLLANMIVNESLPVISDQVLGGGVQAVVVSTVLIVIFAEIIPQSVCSRYGLVRSFLCDPVHLLSVVLTATLDEGCWSENGRSCTNSYLGSREYLRRLVSVYIILIYFNL